MNEFATSFLVVATSIRAIFTHLRAFYVPAYTQGEVRHRVYGHDTIAILWV